MSTLQELQEKCHQTYKQLGAVVYNIRVLQAQRDELLEIIRQLNLDANELEKKETQDEQTK